MSIRQIGIVRTGVANLASIRSGLSRAGARSSILNDPDEVRRAEWVVLPGVGAFAAAMQELHDAGMTEALAERVESGRPTLAVCLGLQLLGESSEESPGTVGLSVMETHARRFGDSVRVPQLGWNQVASPVGSRFLTDGYAYFANSYRITQAPPDWQIAWADHGGPFVAALERGDVLACQFHPELSGRWGIALLERWLEGTGNEEGAAW